LYGAEFLDLCLDGMQTVGYGIELVAIVGQCVDGILECGELVAVVGQCFDGRLDGCELCGVVGQRVDGCCQCVEFVTIVR